MDAAAGVATEDEGPIKLQQTVEIKDVGPCKKHVKVTVDRGAIDKRFDEKFTELVRSDQPQVRGFRPGKVPRKMIEKQYYESVAEEIKSQVLMASLEQLAEEQTISPLSPPEFDPNAARTSRRKAPFVYEFDIEVRPEFDLPDYKGMKLRRPTHTYTPDEVEAEKKRAAGAVRPGRAEGAAGRGPVRHHHRRRDHLLQEKEINKLEEVRVKVEPQLALSDGVADDFGEKMAGAKPGDMRRWTSRCRRKRPPSNSAGRRCRRRSRSRT